MRKLILTILPYIVSAKLITCDMVYTKDLGFIEPLTLIKKNDMIIFNKESFIKSNSLSNQKDLIFISKKTKSYIVLRDNLKIVRIVYLNKDIIATECKIIKKDNL